MAKTKTNLFRGNLVRLTAPTEAHPKTLARWRQDAAYRQAIDTDYARPASAEEVAKRLCSGHPDPRGVIFHLRSLVDDPLSGSVALHSIEWNSRTALLSIGIGERDYHGEGCGADALHSILGYAFIELNLFRVALNTIENNAAAIRA